VRSLSLLALASAAPLAAQPSHARLDSITARGRAIAAYDAAAWRGTDAVRALRPIEDGRLATYVAVPTTDGWLVSFGRLDAARDAFVIAYQARERSGDYEARAFDPPVADVAGIRSAAVAMRTATAAHPRVDRPYNAAVLPTGDGGWWVYLYPAPTRAGVWPLGADTRYRVSADGRTVLERRRMHDAVIEYTAPTSPREGMTLEANYHTAVLDDVPEDTDVFHVLQRTPKVPELVVTQRFTYRIETDGRMRYLGPSDSLRVR
jgi:hypothetical protein